MRDPLWEKGRKISRYGPILVFASSLANARVTIFLRRMESKMKCIDLTNANYPARARAWLKRLSLFLCLIVSTPFEYANGAQEKSVLEEWMADEANEELSKIAYPTLEEAQLSDLKHQPSWGRPRNGLRMGVTVPMDDPQMHSGDTLPLDLFIQNVSDKPLTCTGTFKPEWNVPNLTDDRGNIVKLDKSEGFNTKFQSTLNPGQAICLPHHGLAIGEGSRYSIAFDPVFRHAQIGKYELTLIQPISISVTDQKSIDANLTSGHARFEIVRPVPKGRNSSTGTRRNTIATP